MANDCIPFKKPGADISFKASSDVTGKRFVVPSGNRTGGGAGGLSSDLYNLYAAAHASANGPAVGVAAADVASGKVGHAVSAGIVPVTASGSIAAGARVVVDTGGKAKAWDGSLDTSGSTATVPVIVGIAMTGASDGNDAEILLTIA